MTVSSHSRAKIAALFAILVLSATTMLWLLWRFPLITGLATLAVLTTLGVSARLARLTDTDIADLTQAANDLTHGQQGV